MRSEIKGLFSPDVEDLENYVPEEKDNFCLLLMLLVGPQNLVGEESFEFLLCTPKYFIENNKEKDMIFGHSYLFVQEYNYERLLATIKLNFEIEGEDWHTIGRNLDRYTHWEFGDYDDPVDTITIETSVVKTAPVETKQFDSATSETRAVDTTTSFNVKKGWFRRILESVRQWIAPSAK